MGVSARRGVSRRRAGPLNVSSPMGLVLPLGLVVKNGLLLLSAIFGRLPLAFWLGAGAGLARSLAAAVIEGLGFCTAARVRMQPGLALGLASRPGP
jgi:hypothetical protein